MATVPDRKTLEGMKRVDLQRLCKDHGLRANLKSEALIDLLLSVTGPPKPSQIPQAKRNSSLRIVSRASSVGSRPRGTSSSSVIIHDTDDEDNGGHESEPAPNVAGPSQSRPPVSLPARTTRKAKATQYRLGVGRPTIAGGSGARNVTRSLSVPKSKTSGKISRSVKPTEEAIQEEEEPEPTAANDVDASAPGPSGTHHDDSPIVTLPEPPVPVATPMIVDPPNIEPPIISSDMSEGLKAYLMTIVNPLREQISTLQTELEQATSRLADVAPLATKVSELTNELNMLKGHASRSNQMESEIATLKEQVAMLKVTPRSRTETATSGKSRLTDQTAVSPTHAGPSNVDTYFQLQGLPPSLLGKRGRGAKDELPGIIEADKESEFSPATLATQVVRPSKKRAKLRDHGVLTATVTPAAEEEDEDEELEVPSRPPSGPGFTVFTGPEEHLDTEMDPPPPTTHLSDLVSLSPPNTHSISPITSSANANENQPLSNPFTFTFNFGDAVTSTPAPTSYEAGAFTFGPLAPSLPAPTSPTPGGDPGPSSLYEGRPAGRRTRTGNDLYGNLGHGPNNRPRGAAAGNPPPRPPSRSQQAGPSSMGSDPVADQCISPADLMRPRTPTRGLSAIPEDRDHNPHVNPSRQRASGLTLPSAGMPPETPAPPMKRTMYGTEVDQDTRFGDFGYEGVALGFWTGAAHF